MELIPSDSDWLFSQAYAINNTETVVGYGRDSTGYKGFIYRDGSYTKLLPMGMKNAWAYDINDKGDVVGYTSGGISNYKGFLYRDGAFIELLPSNWTEAYDINDNWVITGYGSYGVGSRGFIAIGLPDIAVTPETIYFRGNIKTGELSNVVTIKNDGTGKLIITAIPSPSPPFSIEGDNCSGQTLAPSETCTVTYRLLPTTSRKTIIYNSKILSNDPHENTAIVTSVVFPDNDGDGYTIGVDCDDNDPSVNPGALEIPNNGKDDDCNPSTPDIPPNVIIPSDK
jgi:probable HAF family extracellular repeat protein